MLDVSQDNAASKVDDQNSIPNMDSSQHNHLSSGYQISFLGNKTGWNINCILCWG
jgi:hypothetical protein